MANKQSLREISPQPTIDPDPPVIRGQTTLYGKVLRVGGEDRPTARVRLISGRVIVIGLPNREMARMTATRLYQTVGFRGIATYDPTDNLLLEFRAEKLTPYREKRDTLSQRVEQLADVLSPHLSAYADVDAIVREARGHNDEDEE